MSDAGLPEGWVETSLEELALFALGGDWGKAPKEEIPDSRLVGCIRAAELRNWSEERGKTAALRRLTERSVEKRSLLEGDLLVEISGGGPEQPVGRVVMVDKKCLSQSPELPKVCTNFFRFVRLAPSALPSFLAAYLDHFYATGRTVEFQGGSNNLRNLKFPDYFAHKLILPPLAEQKRIVAKIEELFAKLDKGIESLRDAQARLKLYRQSLLKHAFEGKLTGDWRAANADKLETPDQILARIKSERAARHAEQMAEWKQAVAAWKKGGEEGKKPTKPAKIAVANAIEDDELESLPNVPSAWRYCRLQEMAEIGSGMSVSKSRKLSDPIEVAYLRVANVQRGALNLNEIKVMKIERSQLAGLKLQPNDVLFNEGGDRDKLGRGWVWEGQLDPCITQNHVFRATPYHRSLQWSKLISHFGNSFGQKYFDKGGKQTTNLASINKTVLKAFPVPVMCPEEMDVLETRLVESMSRLDLVEAEVETQLAKSEALRQSILKQAFSGKLVPQDPNDEPASVLLERIRAERAAAKPPKRQARKRKAKVKV
jgi:type I restriction enzyme, S subunit